MKKLIRRIFNRFGYEIIKTGDRHALKGSRREKMVQVGHYRLSMPGNNPLLNVYKSHPDFNTHFSKLAKAVFQKYAGMTVVDVGANVGDTIALLKSAIDAPVIGIEGDDISFEFLEKNTKQFSGVQIIRTFLGEQAKEIKAELSKAGWNTTIIPNKNAKKIIAMRTLDEVLSGTSFDHPLVKLLKIDAEGFDTIILRGSYQIIDQYHPVLFFEYNPENMQKIGEEGLPTLYSFRQLGYRKIIFFDYLGAILLVTSLENESGINCLHDYLRGKSNLLGFFDIAIFHQADDDIADNFLRLNSASR
jgi:FkbM family methyltransferase